MKQVTQQMRFPLFAGLSEQQRAGLLSRMQHRVYEADAPIVNRGDCSDRFFLINEGRVKVVIYTEDGEEVILGTLTKGEYFGEMGLLDGEPRSASVIALELTQTLSIDRSQFLTFLREVPAATMNIFRALCERLRFADRRIEDLATLDLSGRLIRVMEELADKMGQHIDGGLAIPQHITHQELASMVGATRARVTKTLTFLCKKGIVRRYGKHLILQTRKQT
jgi:CRP/FNR family transcriptional regulator/CRP/FNR family cyclic AMP-dependent transcriptional regulator